MSASNDPIEEKEELSASASEAIMFEHLSNLTIGSTVDSNALSVLVIRSLSKNQQAVVVIRRGRVFLTSAPHIIACMQRSLLLQRPLNHEHRKSGAELAKECLVLNPV